MSRNHTTTVEEEAVVDAGPYSEVLDKLRANGFVLQSDCSLVLKDSGARLDLLKEGVMLMAQ